jgi:hypothetical protein
MRTKTCRTCNASQPLSEYYTHKNMADGHLNICKACVRSRVKTHRKKNDSVREYDRWRYQSNPERKKKADQVAKNWRVKNPEKYRAHYIVSNAIRDKKMQKQPCVICGDSKSHAHHEDYAKPLSVVWLCAKHHQRHHNGGNN